MYTRITEVRRLSVQNVEKIKTVCFEQSSQLRKAVQELSLILIGSYRYSDEFLMHPDDVPRILVLTQKRSTMRTRQALIQFREKFHAILSNAFIILPLNIHFKTIFDILINQLPVNHKTVAEFPFQDDIQYLKSFWYHFGGRDLFTGYYNKGLGAKKSIIKAISVFNATNSSIAGFRIRQSNYDRIFEICLSPEEKRKRNKWGKI